VGLVSGPLAAQRAVRALAAAYVREIAMEGWKEAERKLHLMDQYALGLGKLVANMLALESTLRFALSVMEVPPRPPTDLARLFQASVGTPFPECALTDRDSLGTLIQKYNEKIKLKRPELAIENPEIKRLRDTIAHGRLMAEDPEPPLRIFKFSKPEPGAEPGDPKLVYLAKPPASNRQERSPQPSTRS
jgi:hypothetical protein